MTSTELRSKFLDFFKEKGHVIIPSASLVPENDPTVLFNTAGMQPLVPYLLGEPHPIGKRLADVQKCVRTGDIDEVGDNVHLTFFEMLGNWSLGDYFKDDSITYSYEFLTSKKWLNIPVNKLAFTVFAGDADADFDKESHDKWISLDISPSRIAKLGKEDNWWGAGEIGPCGPDTEIFYWTGTEVAPRIFDPKNKNWVEIWNNVFMEFEKRVQQEKMSDYNQLKLEGKKISADFFKYLKLPKQNVDTGMGLERTLMVLNGKNSVYDTDIFEEIMNVAKTLSSDLRRQRIISDHIRTAVFMIADGVIPSNKDQGSVLRRIIRQMIRIIDEKVVLSKYVEVLVNIVINIYDKHYIYLKNQKERIIKILIEEVTGFEKRETFREEKLKKLLDYLKNKRDKRYERIGAKEIKKGKSYSLISARDILHYEEFTAKDAFNLYTQEGVDFKEAEKYIDKYYKEDILVEDEIELKFNKLISQHQELSRAGAEQKFKGGMGDMSEKSVKYHTATHLLHQALREVLGIHVSQKGSNITPERLRFDFTHIGKMTKEEIENVEKIVNEKIKEKLPVHKVILPKVEAEKTGALHFFGDKYGDQVSVYYIGDSMEKAFSKEFCGGPHVENISILGTFKIQKEEAVSQGVRRIKAILE